mgnify:CR=1 FL=1
MAAGSIVPQMQKSASAGMGGAAFCARLSERAKRMLRFNPIVESLDVREETEETEVYQAFAY